MEEIEDMFPWQVNEGLMDHSENRGNNQKS